MAFLHCVCIGVLLLPWFQCCWGKCIFDKVQRSVKVVSPSISKQNLGHWSVNETARNYQTLITGSEDNSAEHSQRSKRSDRDTFPDPQPIRIKTWIPRESPILSDQEGERLMAAVNEAIIKVSSLLSVIGVPDRLLLNRDINKYCKFIWRNSNTVNYMKCGRANDNYRSESCLDVTIPDEHLNGCFIYPHPDHPIQNVLKPEGAGVPDTDFLLYVFTHSTDKCRTESSVLAYAAHCQTDSVGRPIAGVMVICREHLSVERYTHDHFVQTVLHELFHVLGFSKELYSRWRDCSTSSQADEDCWSYGHVTSTDEMGEVRLYSPAVIRAMQKHLNSTQSDLGAPLENKDAGSDGLSSHWEARVLQGSIMTASLAEPSLVRIDPVTLAALQDTGWYSVNFSRAQSLVWGDGEGGQFGSVSTCHNNSTFFCTGSGLGCHYLHLHKGECLTDQFLDGCFIFKPLANASECWKEQNNSSSGLEAWRGEIFGSDSRCFISNLTRKSHSSSSQPVAGYCYRHRCTGINRYQIQVPDYQGFIFCPNKRLCEFSDLTHTQTQHSCGTCRERYRDKIEEDATHARLNLDVTTVSTLSLTKAEILMQVVLSLSAVFSLLPAAVLIYWKCSSARGRVHAAIEDPYRLELATTSTRTAN
ncbi:ciliated left-right organizer metallopeptidase isoform X2 [Misgurnus anguillicaudatus]|uniref:ciliated left-right organizer metallopeptidase isoform X2 n=1 Tax=Misgurnus anguillicaudatus TaxID=75329 RepID=UPI003CCFA4DE